MNADELSTLAGSYCENEIEDGLYMDRYDGLLAFTWDNRPSNSVLSRNPSSAFQIWQLIHYSEPMTSPSKPQPRNSMMNP